MYPSEKVNQIYSKIPRTKILEYYAAPFGE